MKCTRMQDAARMAARASVPIAITLCEQGFVVSGMTPAGRGYRQVVGYGEAALAGSNVLAELVQRVEKTLAAKAA
jgi:hypothetical protein